MKVKDLIEKLKQCDQEAVVRCPDQWYGEEGSYSEVIDLLELDQLKSPIGYAVVDLGV